MATKTAAQAQSNEMVMTVQQGVVAGLVGGSVFGVQMAAAGMFGMIASMIGSDSVVIGFILHLLISAFIGGTFGLIASRIPASLPVQVTAGALYGIIWWVLGALIIMPLVMGMNEMVLQVNDMATMSLIGHTIFGIVTGAVFFLLRK